MINPAGVDRATWLSRGVELPPRGSPRDLVLRELLNRERAERAAELSMVVRLVGLAAGVDQKQLDALLSSYIDQITHLRYAKASLREADRRKLREDARRLRELTDLNSRS